MRYVSGDGYSKMFEARDEEYEDRLDRGRQFLANPARVWITDYLSYAEDLGFDSADPDIMRRAIEAGTRAYERTQEAEAHVDPRRHEPVVYYMAMGDLVKIGTSTNIAIRLETLRPESLLAVEMGGRLIEAERHRQFAADRNHGEWFRVTPALADHMARARAEFEGLVGLTLDSWLAERSRPMRPPTSPASTLVPSPAGRGREESSRCVDSALAARP